VKIERIRHLPLFCTLVSLIACAQDVPKPVHTGEAITTPQYSEFPRLLEDVINNPNLETSTALYFHLLRLPTLDAERYADAIWRRDVTQFPVLRETNAVNPYLRLRASNFLAKVFFSRADNRARRQEFLDYARKMRAHDDPQIVGIALMHEVDLTAEDFRDFVRIASRTRDTNAFPAVEAIIRSAPRADVFALLAEIKKASSQVTIKSYVSMRKNQLLKER
jgi:hypothetical protein